MPDSKLRSDASENEELAYASYAPIRVDAFPPDTDTGLPAVIAAACSALAVVCAGLAVLWWGLG